MLIYLSNFQTVAITVVARFVNVILVALGLFYLYQISGTLTTVLSTLVFLFANTYLTYCPIVDVVVKVDKHGKE